MSDIFVEVDEALKQDRLEKAWKDYGGYFIAFLLALILGTAANSGYSAYTTNKHEQQTALYMEIIEAQDQSAETLLSAAEAIDGPLATLVEIRAAAALAASGQAEDAKSLYDTISKEKSAPEAFRQLASYMSFKVSGGLSLDEKRAQLEILMNDKANPWAVHAKLDAALLEANEAKDFTKARSYLDDLKQSPAAPQTLQQKAQSLDILYALKEKI